MGVKVIGGPLCGLRRKQGVRQVGRVGDFAWINAGGAVSEKPGDGRLPYALRKMRRSIALGEHGEKRELVYVYAGDSHVRCGCGGWIRKAEGGQERQPCPACGIVPARSS